jgi:hypothetical protein
MGIAESFQAQPSSHQIRLPQDSEYIGNGHDVITDFVDGQDWLRFDGLGFSDLGISQSGQNTTISYGVDDILTLSSINSTLITVDDFQFI